MSLVNCCLLFSCFTGPSTRKHLGLIALPVGLAIGLTAVAAVCVYLRGTVCSNYLIV